MQRPALSESPPSRKKSASTDISSAKTEGHRIEILFIGKGCNILQHSRGPRERINRSHLVSGTQLTAKTSAMRLRNPS